MRTRGDPKPWWGTGLLRRREVSSVPPGGKAESTCVRVPGGFRMATPSTSSPLSFCETPPRPRIPHLLTFFFFSKQFNYIPGNILIIGFGYNIKSISQYKEKHGSGNSFVQLRMT